MRNLVFFSVVLLAGCSSHTAMHLGSGASGGTGVTARIHVHTGSTFAALVGMGFVAGIAQSEAGYTPRTVPELDPTRSVVEHDCRLPITDFSANLRCR